MKHSGTVRSVPAAQESSIQTRRRGPLVLAVDLETLARGNRDETTLLTDRLSRRPHTSLVYAAPARSLHSAKVCIEVLHLPAADVVVADGGASLGAGQHHDGIDALNAAIAERWPGAYKVRTRVQPVRHLLDEQRWDDARRVSYFPRHDVSVEDARSAVEEALADLDVDIRVNEGEQIDVLPPGTDVATTVMHSLGELKVDPAWVVVAGGFIVPRLLHEGGYWGIATGDTPQQVRASLEQNPRVHTTSVEGAGGVLDGLHALGFF